MGPSRPATAEEVGLQVGQSTQEAVHRLFHPNSIAIIGASGDPNAVAGRPLGILQRHGYAGQIYVVNPNHDTVGGLRTYADVASIPGEIDLALISVPARLVAAAVEECGRKGARAAYILTSGFEGQGEQGKDLARELRAAAQRWPVRVAGPNGIGIMNVHDDIPVTFSNGADAGLKPGNIAVISQSGGLAFGIVEYGALRGLGFSYAVSAGNEVDLEAADFLEYFLDDPRTKVVAMFVEGFQSPSRFASLLPRYLERGKSLVIAKMGESEAGRLAAVSHTAHAAGQSELYSALFERYGVYQATDVSDLLDAAAALSCWDGISGRGVGIVTGSGGAAVWTAEACMASGLAVPELEAERQEAIFAGLAYYASARNPVDVTAGGMDSLITAIRAVAASPRIDAVGLIAVGPQLTDAGYRSTIHDLIEETGKPYFAYAHHPAAAATLEAFSELRLPCFLSPLGLATGIKALCQYSEAVARMKAQGDAPSPPEGPPALPQRTGTARVLCEYEVKAWLRAGGFAVPDGRLAKGIDEAVKAGRTLGYPLAVKVQAPSLSHKADAGGVALGVKDEEELRAAYERIMAAAGAAIGDAEVDGALVERMAPGGAEMMVGLKTEPGLGAFVVVAAGGVLTELLDDVVIAPAPLAETEVAPLLRRLKCWPLLEGGNGRPARDVDAFCALVSRISSLGPHLAGVIREADFNPVIVHEATKGVTIVDGLAVWADGEETASKQNSLANEV
jgi:acetate---CoA ligase (ADP-forming)